MPIFVVDPAEPKVLKQILDVSGELKIEEDWGSRTIWFYC